MPPEACILMVIGAKPAFRMLAATESQPQHAQLKDQAREQAHKQAAFAEPHPEDGRILASCQLSLGRPDLSL